ncbi:hypothetical protein [Rickettsiella endosymbiont of Rhagonycha lignosa]|uniref:hypothetical protein n=1 Tax=Rickettsiella endosymbiont of Rhagonycha lignosa TaxID=3077937 RepID=UPI00313E126F
MQIIKNSAKQPMPFYCDILLDTELLKKCDRTLVEKALQLIKNLVEIDPEKAKMIHNALIDYVNSHNKTLFRQTMDIVKLLFLSLLGSLVVSMAIMCFSLALLFFLSSVVTGAFILTAACIGIAMAGLPLLGIGVYTLKAAITLAEKILYPNALKEIMAELTPYYEEAKKELDLNQDKKIVLEGNSVENKPQPISSVFFKSSSNRDNANNEENTAIHLNNMILATQLRK